MERRFRVRLEELLDDAVVEPAVLRGMRPRLERFLEPFVASLDTATQRTHAQHYVAGLVSDLPRKNAEGIAYLHDQERQGLQKFLGQAPWDERPLVTELVRQVGAELGEADAVLVFDPSAFPKKGTASVGVQRQWCGRLGKVENCQVGVYLGYVSRVEHALVDYRLYLPQEWAQDPERCAKAGVPTAVRFRTRHDLALAMLAEHGAGLPHGWIAGDDEMGRPSWFRRRLRELGERYLLAVPAHTAVRDLEAPPPSYRGRGRQPKVPFVQATDWCAALPADAWQVLEVRDGEKGPLGVEALQRRVQAKTEGRRVGPEEVLVVVRERQTDGTWKHDYYLSNASPGTPLEEFGRVAKAEHRIEECLQRGKSEAGLANYQVRTWTGWQHHQALSLGASWFLLQETRRGKKTHACVDGAAGTLVSGAALAAGVGVRQAGAYLSEHDAPLATQRRGPLLPLQVARTPGAPTD